MRVIVKRSDRNTSEQIVINARKSAAVKDFQVEVQKVWGIEPEHQRLLFGGKILQAKHSLMDYGLDNDKVVQLAVRQINEVHLKPVHVVDKIKTNVSVVENVDNEVEEEATNTFYKENDLIDCKHHEIGAWFEAFFIKAIKKSDGIIYKVKFCNDNGVYETSEDCIRPRARHVLDFHNLKPGQIVMLNYNIDEPGKIGFWYDFEILEVNLKRRSKSLKGYIQIGRDVKTCYEIRVQNEIYAIEEPQKIGERNNKLYEDDGKRRPVAPYCDACNDDETADCHECGCSICAKKDNEDKLLVCDECEDFFHIWCLTPPLKEIPNDDWYCSVCQINKNEIVHEGDDLKKRNKARPSDNAKSKKQKNWGGGYACVGLRERSNLPSDHRGPVPGVEVGTSWLYRFQVSETGVHRPPVCGIHGRENDCAYSLVLSGGYEDDIDNGDSFEYTGSGGRDLSGNKRTNKQSFDQKLTRDNKALALNCDAELNSKVGATAKNWKNGIPVRVVRSYKMQKSNKHKGNPYAPKMGYRYDGIYKVVSYRPVKGQSGFVVWRYKLQRDDPAPAPWTEAGRRRIKQLGLTMQYPSEDYTKKRKSDSGDEESPVKKKKFKAYEIEPRVLALINEDEPNEKRWVDLNSHLSEGRIAYDKYVRDAFTCPCCQHVVFKPITTPCQHNMCSNCLKGAWNSGYNTCPVCRSALPKDAKNMEINETLHEILLKLNIIHEEHKQRSTRRISR